MSMTLQAALWRLSVGPVDRVLLGALCDAADDDGTGCFTSESYLIWKTELSRAIIYRRMEALEKLGVITRRPMTGGRIEKIINLAKLPRKADYVKPAPGRPRKAANDTETRANRESKNASANAQRSTQPRRAAATQPDQPDALPLPSADVTPAPAGLVGAAPRGGDARAGAGPNAVVWLDPDEQRRREAANLAALGLTDADAEEYRANPRDWRAAHGIKPRPGAGHTRPAAQPGRSPSRR